MLETKDGAKYRRKLPHFRVPGSIYHCRFSILSGARNLTEDWMFAFVESTILDHHLKDCLIFAYVIMPNHTHLVLQPLPKSQEPEAWCDHFEFHRLEQICGAIKGGSARLINKRLGRAGTLWRSESFDRRVRCNRDLEGLIDYVHHNPVRWKLVESPEQYRWSSAATIYSGAKEYAGWFNVPLLTIEHKD